MRVSPPKVFIPRVYEHRTSHAHQDSAHGRTRSWRMLKMDGGYGIYFGNISYHFTIDVDGPALFLLMKFDKDNRSSTSRRLPTTRRRIAPTPLRVSRIFYFTYMIFSLHETSYNILCTQLASALSDSQMRDKFNTIKFRRPHIGSTAPLLPRFKYLLLTII